MEREQQKIEESHNDENIMIFWSREKLETYFSKETYDRRTKEHRKPYTAASRKFRSASTKTFS